MLDNQKRAFIAVNDAREIYLLPKMANRHGLITGATGTGKTVTLQTLAETFSQMGVPVFAADVKGDLSGVAAQSGASGSVEKRVEAYHLADKGFAYQAFPVQFWDVYGEKGAPVRATISDMGPILLSRLLNLNDIQDAVLSVVFKIAQDEKLELLDLKDLRKILEYVAAHAASLAGRYGNISTASLGAIQRGLVAFEQQGAERFFGEPSLNIDDLMQTQGGAGVINILAADKLMNSSRLYSTFLLWLMSALFENLPEVGDVDKPRLVFFFDEAHLLFNEAPKVLLEKVEQVVRLIRSKGVGIFFISQTPMDIPDSVLGQLGNRVQHALRAYTPKDRKVLRAAAQSFRANPAFSTEEAIANLNIGEALISFLDEQGAPQTVERGFILPPQGQIGPLEDSVRQAMLRDSMVYRYYIKEQDRPSAYEELSQKMCNTPSPRQQAAKDKAEEKARQQEERQRQAQEKQQTRQAKQTRNFWSGVAKSTFVPLIRQFLKSLLKK